MKKANILIESLLALSLLVIVTLYLSQLSTLDINHIEINDPFNELSKECSITCSLKKLIP